MSLGALRILRGPSSIVRDSVKLHTSTKENAMSAWSDGYVKSNGIDIHYHRTGGDKPQVVISHGAGDDGLCWTHVVKELEQDYDVILPDARGHGKSDSGKGDYSTKSRVADLAG